MSNQRGYIDINFSSVFTALFAVGFVFGMIANELIEFFWPFVKAWVHSATL